MCEGRKIRRGGGEKGGGGVGPSAESTTRFRLNGEEFTAPLKTESSELELFCAFTPVHSLCPLTFDNYPTHADYRACFNTFGTWNPGEITPSVALCKSLL